MLKDISEQNSLFVDKKQQYHSKVYNIISSNLIWITLKTFRKNMVNIRTALTPE